MQDIVQPIGFLDPWNKGENLYGSSILGGARKARNILERELKAHKGDAGQHMHLMQVAIAAKPAKDE